MNHTGLEDILQWDVKSWKPALDFWEKEIDWSNIQNALELGGREGGLSLWLAQKGVDMVCSDLENVEETAKSLHEKHNVKVQYQDIDATAIPYENHFDIIVFKSIIGGIGRNDQIQNQEKAFQQMHKALKPGGKLLFAENLAASPLHRFFRKRFVKWGSSWRYVSIPEMESFLKDFSKIEMHTTGFCAAFGRTENQRNLLSQSDKILFNVLTPKSWKYIVYGIAEK